MAGWEEVGGGTAGRGFSAYRASNQVIPNATYTTIVFNSETFDTQNEYNTTTGKYTPQIAGYYIVSGSVTIENLNDGQKFIFRLLKNATIVSIDRGVVGSTDYVGGCVSAVVYLNGSTDYVLVQCYHNHGSNREVAGPTGCFFSGWILPAP